VHPLGDIKGKQLVTVGSTTASLPSTYLASSLQCGSTNDAAPDAAFSFSTSSATGSKVHISLNNPTPGFVPVISLFRGGGPATIASQTPPPNTAIGTTNEQRVAGVPYGTLPPPGAYPALPLTTAESYSGGTTAMANNYPGSVFTQGPAYGSSVCTPDDLGRDAFVSFTVSAPTTVQVSTLGSGTTFNHTLALWDSTPIVQPTPGVADEMRNETRSDAYGINCADPTPCTFAARARVSARSRPCAQRSTSVTLPVAATTRPACALARPARSPRRRTVRRATTATH
jgi:hypothetical protein